MVGTSDDRCHILDAAPHVDAFDGGEGWAESTILCSLLHPCAITDHDATSQDSFYSTSVEVCQSIEWCQGQSIEQWTQLGPSWAQPSPPLKASR